MTEAIGHNQLRSIYARWERLEEEKRATAEDLKELFAEAKSNGYDTKALRAAFRLRALSEEKSAEQNEHEALVDLYLAGLGGTIDAPRAHPRNAREESLGLRGDAPAVTADGTPKPASGAKEAAGDHPTSASEPITRDAENPRAGSARTEPARGTIHDDEGIPAFLDRSNPDCRYGAQGRG